MTKYKCEYRATHKLALGGNWQLMILADTPEEAYETFIQEVGSYPQKVYVEYDLPSGLVSTELFEDHVDKASKSDAEKKEVKQNVNLSTDELLSKIILNQNTQTESLNKIHWAIIVLLIFIVGQWIALKMKWGL